MEMAEGAVFSKFNRKVLTGWLVAGIEYSRTQSGTLRMVRKGDFKLLLDNCNRGQLYNLKSDPSERNNLYNHPAAQEVQHSLTLELALWMLRTQDPLPLPRAAQNGRRYILKRP